MAGERQLPIVPGQPRGDHLSPRDRRTFVAMLWLLGALIRLIPVLQFPGATRRPFGMGGLYLLFAREILHHGLALPTYIPYYTLGGLPYAYPPLAFYIEALALRWLPVPTFVLVNGLPGLFSCLTVGVFFLLARQLLVEDRPALLATAIYALLPAAFLEHLPGEGLVESLGTLLFIAGILAVVRLNQHPGWREAVLLGLFIGLNLLASPGGAYGLALSVVVLWLFRAGGRRAPLGHLLVAVGIGLVLSTPYWLTVSLRHTPAIFFRTFFRQHLNLGGWWLAKMGLVVEQRLPLSPWGVVALIGLAAALSRREWALPLWCLAVYAIPREYTYLVAVPLALLAAHGLQEVILPGAAQPLVEKSGSGRPRRFAAGLLLLVLFAWGTLRTFAWEGTLAETANLVTRDEMAMMDWIHEHTSPQATFLVIGDEIEWFPVLTERTTLNVIWGSEWGKDDTVFRLHRDLMACNLPDCYLETAGRFGYAPDYLYLSRTGQTCTTGTTPPGDALELVWENPGAILFRVRPPGGP